MHISLQSTAVMHTHSICVDLSPSSAQSNGASDPNPDATITIQCLPELTPLDMMDMSFGRSDPTGSCVWLGAFLFMEMFARNPLSADEEMKASRTEVRGTIFPPGCQAVELGAGSGISGLSMMAMSSQDDAISNGPSLLVQTDANEECLALCQINRDANNVSGRTNKCIQVKKLNWGKGNASAVTGNQEDGTSLPTTYDTVFATDVLYDLSSLAPLVTTASELLRGNGYFVLSHVPRASTDIDERGTSSGVVDSWQYLESMIVEEASKAKLHLAEYPADINASLYATNIDGSSHMILRPTLLPNLWRGSPPLSNKHSWQRMIDAGAAILIFQKK